MGLVSTAFARYLAGPSFSEDLELQRTLTGTVELGQDDALKLTQDELAVGNRYENTVIEEKTSKMRSGIVPVTIRQFGRVMPVEDPVGNRAAQKVPDVVEQRGLELVDEHDGRGVLRKQTGQSVTNAGRSYGLHKT